MTTHKHMTESEILLEAKEVIVSYLQGETSSSMGTAMAYRIKNNELCLFDADKILDKSDEIFRLTRLHNN